MTRPKKRGRAGGKLDGKFWREFPPARVGKFEGTVLVKMPVKGGALLAGWKTTYGSKNVGPWAKEKLKILTDYVQIASGHPQRNIRTCAFVDVFSGPGKSKNQRKIRTHRWQPLLLRTSRRKKSGPFSSIYISDADQQLF